MIFTPVMPLYILIPLMFLILGALVYSFVSTSRQGKKAVLRTVVRTVSVLLICLAAFRPAIPTIAEIERLGTNLDIYFVLDTTASMGVQDISGGTEPISRLDAAKEQIMNLAEDNAGARYGLITFSSKAYSEIPLTRDLSSLKSTLDIVKPQLFTDGRGTNTMTAAPLLNNLLVESAEKSPERVRAVYYITDGENTTPNGEPGAEQSLASAATLADARHVIGVGTEQGGDIPLFVYDQNFEVIQDGYYGGISQMNIAQLETIASLFDAELSFIDNTSSVLPPLEVKTVEETLKVVDKKSPAQFEFYWTLIIAASILLILDMNNLFSQLYRLIYRRTY